MTENDHTPVTRALEALGIPHRLFRHAGQVRSLEQAAAERGQAPGQVVRSLLFRTGPEAYVMVLVAGPAQVSWPALRRYLGLSRLTTATPEEVEAVTGYQPGAVSPFGLPQPVRVLVDRSILEHEEVSLGAGVRSAAVFLRSRDLLAGLPGAEVGEFGSTQSR